MNTSSLAKLVIILGSLVTIGAYAATPKEYPRGPAGDRMVPPSPTPVIMLSQVHQKFTEKFTLQAGALFEGNKAILTPGGRAEIDKILVKIRDVRVDRITLTGHTDSADSKDGNHKLGLRWAEAVKEYMVGRGIAANKFAVKSKGDAQLGGGIPPGPGGPPPPPGRIAKEDDKTAESKGDTQIGGGGPGPTGIIRPPVPPGPPGRIAKEDDKTTQGHQANRRVEVEIVGTRTVVK